MVRLLRSFAVFWLLTGLLACGGSPSAPSQAVLDLTYAPNPAPSVGVSSVCMGVTAKTWLYTLTVRNTGGRPFTVSSWGSAVSLSSDFSSPTMFPPSDAAGFAAVFGNVTIPAGQSVSRQLCHALLADEAWIRYSVTGDAGTFTSAILHLLR